MSLDAMVWAVNCPRVKNTSDYAVLSVLAEFAGSGGAGVDWLAWPSQERIGIHARMTDRGVRNCLDRLQRVGAIAPGPATIVAHLPADRRPLVWRLTPRDDELGDGASTLSAQWRREQERRAEARWAKRAERGSGRALSEPRSATGGTSFRGDRNDVPTNQPYRTNQGEPTDAARAEPALPLPAVPDNRPAEPDAGDTIARQWWEAQTPRPLGKGAWHSLLAVCRGAVKVGHQPADVLAALDRCGTVPSASQLDRELRRPNGHGRPSARRQSLTDAADLIHTLESANPRQIGATP